MDAYGDELLSERGDSGLTVPLRVSCRRLPPVTAAAADLVTLRPPRLRRIRTVAPLAGLRLGLARRGVERSPHRLSIKHATRRCHTGGGHRRMSCGGWGGCSPPRVGQNNLFGKSSNFSGSGQKMKNNIPTVYISRSEKLVHV